MRLHTKQCLDNQILKLSYYILIVYALLFIGLPEHLEVPLRLVLVELLLIFIMSRGGTSCGCCTLLVSHGRCHALVFVLHEIQVFLVDGKVRQVYVLLLELARVVRVLLCSEAHQPIVVHVDP